MLSGQKARKAREEVGLSREKVVGLLPEDERVSTKTLERWENEETPLHKWRGMQLVEIYRQHGSQIRIADLELDVATA